MISAYIVGCLICLFLGFLVGLIVGYTWAIIKINKKMGLMMDLDYDDMFENIKDFSEED